MTEYKRYQRTAIAEMVDWHENFDMAGVSVSEADQQAGSPKTGDKIARNPSNHRDRWLVAADYFANNFITIDDFGDAHRTGQEKRAAPELYEALEAFEKATDLWLPSIADESEYLEVEALHMLRNQMGAALAKARGETGEQL